MSLEEAIGSLLRSGGTLPQGAHTAAAASLQRYGGTLAEQILQEATDKFFAGIRSILNPQQELREGGTTATVGQTPQTLRADILDLLGDFGSAPDLAATLNLDFKIKVATEVAQGAGRFVADQTNVEAYPAWELTRVYDRAVPRGEEPKNPSDPWPIRWEQAAQKVDEGELLVSILQHTGRMVALKSSGIWQELGDGTGGHDDALGNPFAPFAFNSGYDTEGVSYNDCVELGLIEKGAQPEPATYDWAQLISIPEVKS